MSSGEYDAHFGRGALDPPLTQHQHSSAVRPEIKAVLDDLSCAENSWNKTIGSIGVGPNVFYTNDAGIDLAIKLSRPKATACTMTVHGEYSPGVEDHQSIMLTNEELELLSQALDKRETAVIEMKKQNKLQGEQQALAMLRELGYE